MVDTEALHRNNYHKCMKSSTTRAESSAMNYNFCVKPGNISFIVDDFRCSMLFRLSDRRTDTRTNPPVKCTKGHVMSLV